MRSKDPVLMQEIRDFAENYIIQNGKAPSTTKIAKYFSIARGTAYRYLVEMNSLGIICYDNGVISTDLSNKCNSSSVSAPILGSIPCGSPEEEIENIEEYIQLPTAIFGKGPFYILKADGDSMVNAGIYSGDLLVIRVQNEAKTGDIVAALTPDNQSTLKRIIFDDENNRVILHPENPNYEDQIYHSCMIQGVLCNVIKYY